MKKTETDLELISELVTLKDKVTIDVGCGTGALVRKLAAHGARITGIDTPEMLEKANQFTPVGGEKYIAGGGENLPFENNYADIILYIASLHHVPPADINRAVKEVHRVLKAGGIVIFVEPVPREGSYYEITRIVGDEKDILIQAYQAIKDAAALGLENKKENLAYFERSFDDYVSLLETFVADEGKRNRYLKEAKEVAERMCRDAGVHIKDYRFKSIVRINVLQKSVEA